MARKKTISYKATARLAVAGGAASIAALAGIYALREAVPSSTTTEMLATFGVLAWLLGAAAGVLSLSTPYSRTGIVGLALCALAIGAVIVSRLMGVA